MSDFLRLQELEKSGERYLILDTETTGLTNAEIVDIAIIDNQANVLLNTLVKPVNPIPAAASKIHGITMDMVADAPGWDTVHDIVYGLIYRQHVVVYNAKFDRHMLYSSDEHCNIGGMPWRDVATWYCCMEGYAAYYGDWNSYHNSYRWQKLTDAYHHLGGTDNQHHRALLDCMMTLYVTRKMFAANLGPTGTLGPDDSGLNGYQAE